jgi:hypothetical protein
MSVSCLLVSRFFRELALCKFTLDFLLSYITMITAVTLPVFAFSIAFSLPLVVLAAVLLSDFNRTGFSRH